MALLVNSGRTILAAALKVRPFHIAWGRGAPWWGATAVENKAFAGSPYQSITLDHTPVANVEVRSADGAILYAASTDYVYDLTAGTITRNSLGAIPSLAAVQILVTYGTTPLSSNDTKLVDEIGRRQAATVAYVKPDAAGSIATPGGGLWSLSETPTRYLYVNVLYDFAEAAGETVREVGVFVDTVRVASVPAGQSYLLPADIADPGYLMLLDHIPAFEKSPAERKGYSYVMTI
jgi:hypothetical protein